MKRRDFIKSGLASLAATGAIDSSVIGQAIAPGTKGTYVEGQQLTLSNQYLDWDFVMSGGTVTSRGFRNKLSGRAFLFEQCKELSLTFSQATARVEIPWWYVDFGPDNDHSSPDQEPGYLKGHHLPDFSGEKTWKTTLNLLLRGSNTSEAPPVFDGYAWFRQWFDLPQKAEGQPLVFCLGGYNQEDWNEYWIYLNGEPIGSWKKSGRWRTPEELSLGPESKAYATLKFGSATNLLAVRGFQTNKRFDGIRDEILDRYIFEGRLCDQFLAVGQPYLRVSDFKVSSWLRQADGERQSYVFELTNPEQQIQVTAHYQLDGFIRRKWFVIRNLADHDRLLLDVDIDQFSVDAATSEGDYGYPVIVGGEAFCAVEHPAGLNQSMDGHIRLRHFPGKTLASGSSMTSKVSIVGVGPQAGGQQQFMDYIQAHSPRKKMISVYDPLGINGFPDDPCWALNDEEMLETADLLQKWQKQGVTFDYYVPDVGWQDSTGDITRFWPHCFPDGPQKVIKRVNELGMKWGLWFTGTWADWTSGLNPRTVASQTVVAGGKWPHPQFRDNFDMYDGSRQLCLASEPYFSMLRDALLFHIQKNNLKFFKLDASSYFCNRVDHAHLPGKYSTEANFDAVIEIARRTREVSPDLYIMWYWGIRSPFFALHGDSIFETRLRMEAASTGDFPALFFRDAVTLALDQGAQFNDLIPPINKDSLGVWITDTWWGNAMRKERWREAIVMDLGRGNLLFPQLWGELRLFSDQDIAFLARIQKLAKANEKIFYKRKTILGNPWDNEIYGYAYFQGAHGFVFMNNVDFQSRKVKFNLDETINLKASPGMRMRIISHFPEQSLLHLDGTSVFQPGQSVETWLRPFEVAMWEIIPDRLATGPTTLAPRHLSMQKPDIQSHRLSMKTLGSQPAIANMPGEPGLEIDYGPPIPNFRSSSERPTLDEFERMGYRKRMWAQQTTLPHDAAEPQVLAILLRFRKGGKLWRYKQPADLVQAKATIGEQPILRFETVPNFRQTENNEWCPWLVFKIRTSDAWSGKDLVIALNAYLPPEVDVETEGWLVPQWWNSGPAM